MQVFQTLTYLVVKAVEFVII